MADQKSSGHGSGGAEAAGDHHKPRTTTRSEAEKKQVKLRKPKLSASRHTTR